MCLQWSPQGRIQKFRKGIASVGFRHGSPLGKSPGIESGRLDLPEGEESVKFTVHILTLSCKNKVSIWEELSYAMLVMNLVQS